MKAEEILNDFRIGKEKVLKTFADFEHKKIKQGLSIMWKMYAPTQKEQYKDFSLKENHIMKTCYHNALKIFFSESDEDIRKLKTLFYYNEIINLLEEGADDRYNIYFTYDYPISPDCDETYDIIVNGDSIEDLTYYTSNMDLKQECFNSSNVPSELKEKATELINVLY